MRTSLAVPLVLAAALAAAAPVLAKPAAGAATDPARETWRGQGTALCVAELNALEGLTPGDSEGICRCAFERFMDGRATDALPPLVPGRLAAALGGDVLDCTIQHAPARAAAVSRWMAQPMPSAAPPLVEAPPPPPEEGGKPTASDAPAAGPDLRGGLAGLALPRWLTGSGLPLWAWVPLALFVFLFLRGLLRRRDGTRDLLGPPPSMRHGGPAARRPDPPPRI